MISDKLFLWITFCNCLQKTVDDEYVSLGQSRNYNMFRALSNANVKVLERELPRREMFVNSHSD